jgi:hypothetical protein
VFDTATHEVIPQGCEGAGPWRVVEVLLKPGSVPAKLGRHAAIELRGKPGAHGGHASERLSLGEVGKTAQGQSWSPIGLAKCDRPGQGGLTETWTMEKAKRARKAETPKQPSLSLRLRAPYFYPDQETPPRSFESASAKQVGEDHDMDDQTLA